MGQISTKLRTLGMASLLQLTLLVENFHEFLEVSVVIKAHAIVWLIKL